MSVSTAANFISIIANLWNSDKDRDQTVEKLFNSSHLYFEALDQLKSLRVGDGIEGAFSSLFQLVEQGYDNQYNGKLARFIWQLVSNLTDKQLLESKFTNHIRSIISISLKSSRSCRISNLLLCDLLDRGIVSLDYVVVTALDLLQDLNQSLEASNYVDILLLLFRQIKSEAHSASLEEIQTKLNIIFFLSKAAQSVNENYSQEFFVGRVADSLHQCLRILPFVGQTKNQENWSDGILSATDDMLIRAALDLYTQTLDLVRVLSYLHVHNVRDFYQLGLVTTLTQHIKMLLDKYKEIRKQSDSVNSSDSNTLEVLLRLLEELCCTLSLLCRSETVRRFIEKEVSMSCVFDATFQLPIPWEITGATHLLPSHFALAIMQLYTSCYHLGIRKQNPADFLRAIFEYCMHIIVIHADSDLAHYSAKESVGQESHEATELVHVSRILSMLSRAVEFSGSEYQSSFQTAWQSLLRLLSSFEAVPTSKITYINIVCLLIGKRNKCWLSPLPIFEDLTDTPTFAMDYELTSRSIPLSNLSGSIADILQVNNPTSSFLKEIRNATLEAELQSCLLGSRHNTHLLERLLGQRNALTSDQQAISLAYLSCIIRTVGIQNAVENIKHLPELGNFLMSVLAESHSMCLVRGLAEQILQSITGLIDSHMLHTTSASIALDQGMLDPIVDAPAHTALLRSTPGNSALIINRDSGVSDLSNIEGIFNPSSVPPLSKGGPTRTFLLFKENANDLESKVIGMVGDKALKLVLEECSPEEVSDGRVYASLTDRYKHSNCSGGDHELLFEACLSSLTTLAPWSRRVRRLIVTNIKAIVLAAQRHCQLESVLFPLIRLCVSSIDNFHKLEFEGDVVIVNLIMKGLDNHNVDVRMVTCELIASISALNPTVIHRAVSRREIEDRLLRFWKQEVKNPQRLIDILRACLACAKDINLKPNWIYESWTYHWSNHKVNIMDEAVMIPQLAYLFKNYTTYEAHSIPILALSIGLSAGIMKNCVAVNHLSKFKLALIKLVIPMLPISLDILVRKDNNNSATIALTKIPDAKAAFCALELLAAHTIHAVQAFMCLSDDMFPMAVYLQSIAQFSRTPLCACVCFIMNRFKDNVSIQRNCMEIIRCFVDNRLELTALGMHSPSAIMHAIKALPEERRPACSFSITVSVISTRDEFARDNLLRFRVFEGLAHIIRVQTMDAAPLACAAVVDLCDTPEHAKTVNEGLIGITHDPHEHPHYAAASPNDPIDKSSADIGQGMHPLSLIALIFELLRSKPDDIKTQVEGLRAIMALCQCKEILQTVLFSPKSKATLRDSRSFLSNLLNENKAVYTLDYPKEMLLQLLQWSHPMRLQQKCNVM